MFFKVRCAQEHKWWTIMDVDRLVVSDPIKFSEKEPPLCNLNLIDERLNVDSYYVANVIKDQADGITQKEYTIAFNTQAYLCNDEGKTTECFILSREEKERVVLRVEMPVDMEPSAPEVSELISKFVEKHKDDAPIASPCERKLAKFDSLLEEISKCMASIRDVNLEAYNELAMVYESFSVLRERIRTELIHRRLANV